jgi:non-heme chloroperoxidase
MRLRSVLVLALAAMPAACQTARSESPALNERQRVGIGQATVLRLDVPAARIATNGVSLAYVDRGSGEPIVLVHGSIADYRVWANQIPALARRYRVVAYSRRYHPPNVPPGPDADAGVDEQADDLAGLIEGLRLGPTHIVGHSFGGTVAAVLALKRPELVRSLVLAEPGLGTILSGMPENEAHAREAQAVRAERREAWASGDPERIVRTHADRDAPGVLETLSAQMRTMLLANVPALRLDADAPRPPIGCEDLGRIKVPVLVIAGNRSSPGLQRIAEATAKCIETARLARLAGATHWMHLDQPQAFNAAVLAFLATRSPARR